MKIKAIVFDIGGVLVKENYSKKSLDGHYLISVHKYMAKKLKIDLDSWFDSIDSLYAKAIEGLISRDKTIERMANNLKINKNFLIKYFKKAYRRSLKNNKSLYKIAFKLKKNYKIAILSDQWYLSKDVYVNKRNMSKFDQVIISCDVGMRKPDLKIYQLLIKKLKLKPSEIIFIDNREFNLKPAEKLGIKTILFKNNKELLKEFKKLNVKI